MLNWQQYPNKGEIALSMFNRPTPPTWRILLYTALSIGVLLLLGRLAPYILA
ncbi:hypothetical protein [Anaerotruncus colihominis]|uniref:Uncharacterized protein n=1 Tax=Anaerotruncus colihominis DSM 17241 TaxID=445972 RepID=B0P8Z4_9FIRM|nr:hypothetical protein [Anaerotruncus colihominis]EDS12021.1 hypothetical protein ANACOL_01241 [Anaerotruncus colihominis DSM 17241]MCQ4732410.1 hypothetical protein [Anaerotruncus colihominis]UOX64620.1 hypothetical protein K5I23_11505 [Anaerotruncus colihominis]UWN74159.1 hypothetical protein NQ528_13245 [Anaerotruncus colihominis]HJF54899.1 hypothetical protein [Anaerotruncus colihominis]